MRVLGDRVLVAIRPEPDEIETAGGLVLARDPDIIRTPTQGIVVQLGERSGAVDREEVLSILDGLRHLRVSPPSQAIAAYYEQVRGLIKALGPAPFDVQVGDCVLFTRFVGEEVTEGDLTYLILRESEIIGIVEPKKEAA